jgi:type II secretion system protein H
MQGMIPCRNAPMQIRTVHSAFTLLELILVMVIISIALALASPSLSNWSRGGKLRDARDQFLALTRYARTQAAAEGRVFRLNVDAQAGRYWLTAASGADFVAPGTEFGRVFTLPEGFKIELTDGAKPLEFIDFFPTGRTQPAHVRFISDEQQPHTLELECPSPAEGFTVVSAPEVGQ